MFLNKLYSGPTDLFEPVEFRHGLNFIYGIKDNMFDSNDSLNAIGKSLFLDFLDFALLSYFNNSNNARLARAYNNANLKDHYIVLEFKVNKTQYSISRFFDDPYIAYFSEGNTSRKKYKLPELQNILFELIFERTDYAGYFSSAWYRNLMKFFLKIQKVSDEKFTNPIRYTNLKELILNQYHLFLLNIDNTLAYENYNLLKQIDNYTKTISTSKQLIAENFDLKDFASVQNEITRLENQIKRVNSSISSFRLSNETEVLQQRANVLTAEINSLSLLNSIDNNRIQDYQNSIKEKHFASKNVKDIYDEINPVLGDLVKNSLDDAVEFRKNLINSRKDFIDKEMADIRWRIRQRNQLISNKENERSEILKDLSSKNALSDLTSAYARLNKLSNKKAELSSKLDLYKQSKTKIDQLKNSAASMDKKIKSLVLDNKEKLDNFNNLLKEIYTNVFGTLDSEQPFSIDNTSSNQKIKLNVLSDDVYSHGKNQGRTLVYDLAVLFNMINNNIKGPRFLVHDSIFDSLDKAHLKSLYDYLSNKEEENDEFQYIITLNQQTQLHDEILNKTVLPIYASEKLLGLDFK